MGKTKRQKISNEVKEKVYNKYNGKCIYCGEKLSFEDATIEHLIPISRGGSNEIKNLAIACCSCNKKKSDDIFIKHIEKMEDVMQEMYEYTKQRNNLIEKIIGVVEEEIKAKNNEKKRKKSEEKIINNELNQEKENKKRLKVEVNALKSERAKILKENNEYKKRLDDIEGKFKIDLDEATKEKDKKIKELMNFIKIINKEKKEKVEEKEQKNENISVNELKRKIDELENEKKELQKRIEKKNKEIKQKENTIKDKEIINNRLKEKIRKNKEKEQQKELQIQNNAEIEIGEREKV